MPFPVKSVVASCAALQQQAGEEKEEEEEVEEEEEEEEEQEEEDEQGGAQKQPRNVQNCIVKMIRCFPWMAGFWMLQVLSSLIVSCASEGVGLDDGGWGVQRGKFEVGSSESRQEARD